MSIASEISRISGNVQNTIDTIEATGVTVPEGANSDNLPSLAQALANTKQDKLTGVEGQVVGFDSQGNAIAQDAPSGLPSGGTPGQLLSKTESGAEWVDKPVMYVHITESDGTYSADKTFEEIQAAYNAGYAIFASTTDNIIFSLSTFVPDAIAQFSYINISTGYIFYLQIYADGVSDNPVLYSSEKFQANGISFTPASGLTSTNVQDAIEELAEKVPTSSTITLFSDGWSSNSQTITLTGVKTSGQDIHVSPKTKADADAWAAAGVWCNEPTTAGQLTFTCETEPTQDINVNVELVEVQS